MVFGRVLSEVALFVMALAFVVVAFATSIMALEHVAGSIWVVRFFLGTPKHESFPFGFPLKPFLGPQSLRVFPFGAFNTTPQVRKRDSPVWFWRPRKWRRCLEAFEIHPQEGQYFEASPKKASKQREERTDC